MSKRINISSKFFHHWVATPFLFFRTKRGGDNPTGTPLPGGSNAGGVGKKRDSGRISGLAAYRFTVLSTVRVANCEKHSRDGRRRASSTPRRPLFAQDDDNEVFVTRSTLYADKAVIPRTQPPLVITPFSAAVGHRRTEPGVYFCRKLTPTCTRSLDTESAATLVHSFVASRIDYCNAVLAGAPKATTKKLHEC